MLKRVYLSTLSILSAILLVLSFPGYDHFYFVFVAFVPFLYMLDKASSKEIILNNLLFSIFFIFVTFYWMIEALQFKKADNILIIGIYFSIILLFMILKMIPFSIFFKFVEKRPSYLNPLLVPAFWITIELGLNHILPASDWVLIGSTQYKNLPFIQITDITGIYGVSFFIILTNYLIYKILFSGEKKRKYVFYLIFIFLVNFGYGFARLRNEGENSSRIKIALIQARFNEETQWWLPGKLEENFNKLILMTIKASKYEPDLIIWPEGGIPFALRHMDNIKELIINMQKKTKRYLLTGSRDSDDINTVRDFNTAFLISPDGEIIAKYNKQKLAPLGEYRPKILFFLSPRTRKYVEFMSGKESNLLEIPQARFGVLICWESVFPDAARIFSKNGALFLVNISNDHPLRRISACKQHFSHSVFRAIENRKWVVRCSSIGISSFISPKGMMSKTTNLFEETYCESNINLIKKSSFYTRYGDLFSFFCVALLQAIFINLKKRT